MGNPLMMRIPLDTPSLSNKVFSVRGVCRKGLLLWVLLFLCCVSSWSFSENQGTASLWPWSAIAFALGLLICLAWVKFGRATPLLAPFLVLAEGVLLGTFSVLTYPWLGSILYGLVAAGLVSSLATFIVCRGLSATVLSDRRRCNVASVWLWLLTAILLGIFIYLAKKISLPLPVFADQTLLGFFFTAVFAYFLLRRQLADLGTLERAAGVAEQHYEWSSAAALLFNILWLMPAAGWAIFDRLRFHSFWERM